MRIQTIAAIFFLVVAPLASRPQAGVAIARNAATDSIPRGEIDDPNSGARWILYGSANGGPGRWVLIAPSGIHADERGAIAPAMPRPVIHGGDRIVLEEHTAVVDARLEAIALGPAAAGGELRVRIVIGGRIEPAVALAPGRALLAQEGVQ